MKLSQLLEGLASFQSSPSGPGEAEITGITCDSRLVEPGFLFAALPGARRDGRQFIPEALERGAAALLVEGAEDHSAPSAYADGIAVPVVCVSDIRKKTEDHSTPSAYANGSAVPVLYVPDVRKKTEGISASDGDTESSSVPILYVKEIRKTLARLSAAFYGHPAEKLTLIGITGTKGKTTTAHILKSVLEAAGCKTAMCGTLGGFIGDEKVLSAENTTPEPVALHRFFAQAVRAGCSHLVMEVSSQALKQGRVYGIRFDLAVFLNLSPDHIGGAEHADFAEYLSCKSLLFRQCRAALANSDDPRWREVVFPSSPSASDPSLPAPVPVTSFGFGPGGEVRGGAVRPVREANFLGSEFSVSFKSSVPSANFGASASSAAGAEKPEKLERLERLERLEKLRIALPGPFNAENALAAAAAARMLSLSENAVRRGLASVSVPGRTELLPFPGKITVVIDYAHNGASFRSVLSALADCKTGEGQRLIVVFGAGGDRPKLRRRDMAREAAQYADFAVITADNPRWEPLEEICADIAEALKGKIPSAVICGRAEAIRFALDMAREKDIVALLGKGHEEYIECRGVRLPFSERAVVDEAAKAREPGKAG